MAIQFNTLDQLIEFLPPVPAYRADDPTWWALSSMARTMGVTSEGLRKMLQRYRNCCVHKTARASFVHTPTFMRLYSIERHLR